MSLSERNKLLGEFWTTVSLLETVDEVKSFFKDLLSETEAVMLARRLKIAQLISAGWNYEKIEKALHTSSNTIAAVHAWLDGGFGGYALGLARLKKELRRRVERSEAPQ